MLYMKGQENRADKWFRACKPKKGQKKMKRKMLVVLLLATTILAGCQADASKDADEDVSKGTDSVEVSLGKADNEIVNSSGSGQSGDYGELTVADIKQKYTTAETEDIMPLYNVAEDQVFDFTFQTDWYGLSVPESELVTIHTDSKCQPESTCYTSVDIVENEKGFTISLSPISAVMETVFNEEDEINNEHAVWGNAPVYYIAIHYDMESEELTKMETPTIIPFTIKHEVQAPEVRGEVGTDGRFRLIWEPVEGAEEYRIYNLVDGNQWTGENNSPVDGAESGYMLSTLLYMGSTTETEFMDFDGSGEDSVAMHERSVSGKLYCIGQNYSVCGEYYVSAVVDGRESGFASAVRTSDLQIPYQLTDESDIMFADFEKVEDLPLTLEVVNIDGSVTPRNVCYTFQWENTWIEGQQVPEYAYQIEGTMLSGCVSMRVEGEVDLPETVGELSTIGRVEPENDINMQPDADVETIIETESDSADVASLVEQQIENTEKHIEKGDKQTTEAVGDKYMIFADSAEEEWLALNMLNGENEISVEAFPSLQYAENLQDVFYKVYYQNPYILGVSKFGYDYNDMTFYVDYAYTGEEMEQMREEIYEEAETILDEIVTDGMSDEEKRMAIYKYLEDNCEYDYDALENAKENGYKKSADDPYEYAFNTYGILVEKKGVCQSFAYAYKLLCNMSGLECNVMTGYLDGSLPHAWNVVKIEGEWYQTDSTNNGNVSGIPYFLYNSDSETARKTGFSTDALYEVDAELADYESLSQEHEYYFANNMYAEGLDEYAELLDELVQEDVQNICIRYDGETPDEEEFQDTVMEVFYRKNLENELADMVYMISNNFIVLTKAE